MKGKTAIIFGSTGLIGNLLLEELILSVEYQEIKIFVRTSVGISHPKVQEFTVDFSIPGTFSNKIIGDDIFICLGTTIKKAGSVKRMEEIDRHLPVTLAFMASSNGVKKIAVISSLGANPKSRNYYLRIKGDMEQEIMRLKFEQIAILRPSMLLGERKERRTGESAGKIAMKVFNPLLMGKMKKYRGIHAKDVAKAMITILKEDHINTIYESDEIQRIATLNQ